MVEPSAVKYANPSAGSHASVGEEPPVTERAMELLRDYSRERPEVVALWCFGIGFVLGWKLKPW